MRMPPDHHIELKLLLEETLAVAKENRKMLRSIRRIGIFELILRLLWYAILVGMPFALYYYVIGPYFQSIGASYGQFNQGVQNLPLMKVLGSIFGR